jgi:hypothetical protein
MNWRGIFKKYIWNSSYDIIVLEEGTLQYNIQIPLFGEEYSSAAQRKLISSFIGKEDHLFVGLKIDTETAMERIQSRAAAAHSEGFSSWLFEDETEDYQLQKADQAINLFESTFNHIKALRPDSLIEIDSRKDPKENAERVLAFIDKHFPLKEKAGYTNSRLTTSLVGRTTEAQSFFQERKRGN